MSVSAGTYTEQVRIDKTLDLVGAGAGSTTILAPAKASRVTEDADHGFGLRTYDYLVGVFGTGGETVNISGFTLDGNLDAKSSGPGTFRSQQLTFFNASGTIEDNILIDWQDPAAFGAQGVSSLVAGSLTPVTVDMLNNEITGYQKGGIVAFGTGAVDATIEGNTITGAGPITSTAQNGIQISNGATGAIIANTVSDNNYTPMSWCSGGILVYLVDGVLVQDNILSGSLCDLLLLTNDSTIQGNQVASALEWSFSVIGNGNIVHKNYVNGSPYDGMYVDGINNEITCNRVTNNGTLGVCETSLCTAGYVGEPCSVDSDCDVGAGIAFDDYSGPGTPNPTNQNVIVGNVTYGVDASVVAAPPDIDATNNWWGCVAGPGNLGCDGVTANVTFNPWATSAPTCAICINDADCDDGLACTGTETCNLVTGQCEAGTPVDCSDLCETGVCEEPAGTCEVEVAGTTCRAAAGVCDVEETCDGIDSECPPDAKSTDECRAVAGVCDVAENCDGQDNDCPADGFRPLSTPCDVDGDVCTMEHCDGQGAGGDNCKPFQTTPVPACVGEHYKCYRTRQLGGRFAKRTVNLEDQFGQTVMTVSKPRRFCNPVDKEGEGITDPTTHMMCYKSRGPKFQRKDVVVENQFGQQTLTVIRPYDLCLPAEKDGVPSELRQDHFKCYKVRLARGSARFTRQEVSLEDQFESRVTEVVKPKLLCNPVDKEGEGILNPEGHLVCYRIKDAAGQPKFQPQQADIVDQFGEQDLNTLRGDCRKSSYLCLPSTKRLASPSGAFIDLTGGLLD